MRNRAKCKKCNDIVENISKYDLISCKCGEISVDGGKEYFHVNIKDDIDNLILVDDEGNEIIPGKKEEANQINDSEGAPKLLDKKSMLDELNAMMSSYENLPPEALYASVTHADFYSLLLVLSRLLES